MDVLAVARGEGAEAGMVVGLRLDLVLCTARSEIVLAGRDERRGTYGAVFGDMPHKERSKLEEW